MSYNRFSFPDGQVVCPYDNSHILGNFKAFAHLDKCRKKHPELAQQIHICPYNQSHHIPSHDMKDHYKVCKEYSASKSFDTMAYHHGVNMNEGHQHQEGFRTFQPGSDSQQKQIATTQVEEDVTEWM